MGTISRWNIEELKKEFKLTVAIETGTAYGDGARYLANIFEKVHTIEMDKEFYGNLKGFPDHPNIYVYLGKTIDILPEVLFANNGEPTLFWLDAHLPRGEDHDDRVNLPLEEELMQIYKYKDISNDVFIIDDLRIYEDGPFEVGNWAGRHDFSNASNAEGSGLHFVLNLFKKTHRVEKSYKDEGYLLLKPFMKAL